jgi:hypothetical protein
MICYSRKTSKQAMLFNPWPSHTRWFKTQKQGSFYPWPSHTCWFKTGPPLTSSLGQSVQLLTKLDEPYLCNETFHRQNKTCEKHNFFGVFPYFITFLKYKSGFQGRIAMYSKTCIQLPIL